MIKNPFLLIMPLLFIGIGNTIAQSPYLVKDINPGSGYSSPASFTVVGNVLFFTAEDPAFGRELWKSDGTAAGTVRVADIWPGPGSSAPDNLTNVGDILFFTASDSTHGTELWKSDGSESNTAMVKDIWTGVNSSNPDYLTAVGSDLFFSADNGGGAELWLSNGSFSGTNMVVDIQYDGGSSPYGLTNVGGLLYFAALQSVSWATHGIELWQSNGTAGGTFMVKDIWPGVFSPSSNPNNLTSVGGILLFSANDGVSGAELWKSSGSAASTTLVRDIYSGSAGSLTPTSNFINVNGRLYFTADDGNYGVTELWKSDLDSTSTTIVKDIYQGSIYGSSPAYLTKVDTTLYFSATDGNSGRELWRSNGSSASTVMIKDIYPGTTDSNPEYIINGNGCVYFSASTASYTGGLWQSDGTAAGTVHLGGGVSSAKYLTRLNNKIFFSGFDGANGTELWVDSITCQPASVSINDPADLNSQMFVYPNPAATFFTITNALKLKNAHVEIYNLPGKMIYSGAIDGEVLTVNCEQFSNGIYFVKLFDSKSQCFKKVVVAKD